MSSSAGVVRLTSPRVSRSKPVPTIVAAVCQVPSPLRYSSFGADSISINLFELCEAPPIRKPLISSIGKIIQISASQFFFFLFDLFGL